MNNLERLELEKMINSNNVQDCTESIREKKHSEPLKESITKMLSIMQKNQTLKKVDETKFNELLETSCGFLYNNYTDIFNRIKNNEIDTNILLTFVDILKKIENKELDQHDGSYEVGKILKSIYIDSALKKAAKLDEKQNKLNEESGSTTAHKANPCKEISWKQYKYLELLKKN